MFWSFLAGRFDRVSGHRGIIRCGEGILSGTELVLRRATPLGMHAHNEPVFLTEGLTTPWQTLDICRKFLA